MARCAATTKSGERCKLEARPGSRFCHMHQPAEEAERAEEAGAENGGAGGDNGAARECEPLGDLIPLLLAGAGAAVLLLVLRSFGKWMPRL